MSFAIGWKSVVRRVPCSLPGALGRLSAMPPPRNRSIYYVLPRPLDHAPYFAKTAGRLPALIIVLGGSGHCGARQRRAISASQRYPDAECRDDDPLTC